MLAVFGSTDSQLRNSEMRTRYMWKYVASRTVTGTPTAIVNGIILQHFPETAD